MLCVTKGSRTSLSQSPSQLHSDRCCGLVFLMRWHSNTCDPRVIGILILHLFRVFKYCLISLGSMLRATLSALVCGIQFPK